VSVTTAKVNKSVEICERDGSDVSAGVKVIDHSVTPLTHLLSAQSVDFIHKFRTVVGAECNIIYGFQFLAKKVVLTSIRRVFLLQHDADAIDNIVLLLLARKR
jgi:hypothetical protein